MFPPCPSCPRPCCPTTPRATSWWPCTPSSCLWVALAVCPSACCIGPSWSAPGTGTHTYCSFSRVEGDKRVNSVGSGVCPGCCHINHRCCACVCVFSRQPATVCPSVPVLRVEEWMLPGDSLTGDTVRALIDRVSGARHASACKSNPPFKITAAPWRTAPSWAHFSHSGQQQRSRWGSLHRLGPPAGWWDHRRQAEQSKEGLSLALGQPSGDASEGQRAGREQPQSR